MEFHKSMDDIIRMSRFWCENEKGFKISGAFYWITAADMKRIFGLDCVGIIHNLDAKMERPRFEFFDNYVGDSKRIKKTFLDSALDKAIEQDEAQDVAILVVM